MGNQGTKSRRAAPSQSSGWLALVVALFSRVVAAARGNTVPIGSVGHRLAADQVRADISSAIAPFMCLTRGRAPMKPLFLSRFGISNVSDFYCRCRMATGCWPDAGSGEIKQLQSTWWRVPAAFRSGLQPVSVNSNRQCAAGLDPAAATHFLLPMAAITAWRFAVYEWRRADTSAGC